MALHTLMVVILIQLRTTGEPTLFHTLCAGEQSVRRQMYESIEEEECGEEDEDKFTGRTYIDKHRSKITKQSICDLFLGARFGSSNQKSVLQISDSANVCLAFKKDRKS